MNLKGTIQRSTRTRAISVIFENPSTTREWNTVAVTYTYTIESVSVQDFDLGSGMAESHGRAMKIVAEYKIRESEVEVVEEEKQPWH